MHQTNVGSLREAAPELQVKGEVKMKAIVNRAKAFLKSEDGPTATEYAVMLALIIVVCIGAVKSIGTSAKAQFEAADAALQ